MDPSSAQHAGGGFQKTMPLTHLSILPVFMSMNPENGTSKHFPKEYA